MTTIKVLNISINYKNFLVFFCVCCLHVFSPQKWPWDWSLGLLYSLAGSCWLRSVDTGVVLVRLVFVMFGWRDGCELSTNTQRSSGGYTGITSNVDQGKTQRSSTKTIQANISFLVHTSHPFNLSAYLSLFCILSVGLMGWEEEKWSQNAG